MVKVLRAAGAIDVKAPRGRHPKLIKRIGEIPPQSPMGASG